MEIKKISRAKVERFSPVDLAIAKALYEKGVHCLKLAYKNSDKKMLVYSSELLMESIKLYQKNIEPYVCLSYIALSVSQFELAWKMIKSAEKISPESPDVKAISEKISKYLNSGINGKKSVEALEIADESVHEKGKSENLLPKKEVNQNKKTQLNPKKSFFSVKTKPLLPKNEENKQLDKPRVVSLGIMKNKNFQTNNSSNPNLRKK